MLNLRKVMGAKPKEHVKAELAELYTPWGEALDCDHVLEEHPNPQLEREVFQVLNGKWRCAFKASGHAPGDDLAAVTASASPPAGDEFDSEIVVPFSPEAPLSGVKRQLKPDELLWYRRTFRTPELGSGARCLLHFQAVDYACACMVNGKLVGTHVGGYTPFTFDITSYLGEGASESEDELLVCVADPSEFGGRLRGKQRIDRGDIWYTAQSGIWQTVWLEVVPSAYIRRLEVHPDPRTGILVVGVEIDGLAPGASRRLRLDVFDEQGNPVAADSIRIGSRQGAKHAAGRLPAVCEAIAVMVPEVRLWSPDDPYLYQLRLTLGQDEVESYCAFRSVEVRRDDAHHPRVFLNGEPYFIKGVLDQAYWPDGLMTAPSDEALVFDIEAMRDAGFNLMRKHIKVESARWYYHCDRLGMLVLQDMVSGGAPEINLWNWSYKPTLFKASWSRYRDDTPAHREKLGAGDAAYRAEWMQAARATVELLRNHPCIIGWSLFNEGWGQFDARKACETIRHMDDSRLIDAVSGWYDQQCGDFSSVHNYFRDLVVWPCRHGRAFFISEFGGFSHHVEGHCALDECYGYEIYEDLDVWRHKVSGLLNQVGSLEEKGLSGYVYTQVSDVEEETNGILTYDRRVNKLSERCQEPSRFEFPVEAQDDEGGRERHGQHGGIGDGVGAG